MGKRGTAVIVLDCSAFMAMVLPDETHTSVDSIALKIECGDAKAIAPALFRTEAANACLMAYKRGRIDKRGLFGVIVALLDTPIILDQEDQLFRRTELSLEFDLTMYDASYLECAERHKAPLLTLDKKLMRAAKEMQLACEDTFSGPL